MMQASPSTKLSYLLYIPFWIYSNGGYGYVIEFIKKEFTFHSGYIPMKLEPSQTGLTIVFTFHSGYILIQGNF